MSLSISSHVHQTSIWKNVNVEEKTQKLQHELQQTTELYQQEKLVDWACLETARKEHMKT